MLLIIVNFTTVILPKNKKFTTVYNLPKQNLQIYLVNLQFQDRVLRTVYILI